MKGNSTAWQGYRRLLAAGIPTTAKTAGALNNSEKIAHEAFLKLSPRDKHLVRSWRTLGNSWFDAMVNSGVLLSSGRRKQPEDPARAEEPEHIPEIISKNHEKMALTGEKGARRHAAEHEAAHLILAQSFGLSVKLAHVLPGGSGRCLYEATDDLFQTAAICLAGETWIGVFRSREWPGGPTGCEEDRRKAIRALPSQMQREKAYRYCYLTLKSDQQTVLNIATQIEKDGFYVP